MPKFKTENRFSKILFIRKAFVTVTNTSLKVRKTKVRLK